MFDLTQSDDEDDVFMTQSQSQSLSQSQPLSQRDINKQTTKQNNKLIKEAAKKTKADMKKLEIMKKNEDSGKHKDHEISIVIDNYFHSLSHYGWDIEHYFQENFPNYGFFLSTDMMIPMIIKRDQQHQQQQQQQQQDIIPGIIRWTFRKHKNGGKCNVGTIGSKTLPFNVIITPCGDFLDSITDSKDYVSFPTLEKWIVDLKKIIYNSSQQNDKDQVRIVLILNDIEKEAAKPKYSNCLITDLIDSAIAFLIFELQIEVLKFKEKNEFLEYLSTVTKINSELFYKSPIDELDCEKKAYKMQFDDEYASLDTYQKEQYEIKEQWIGMLTMIDMVSKDSARNIANIYSCPKALYEAYNNCSTEKERRMLLANIIRPGTIQKNLSNQIYEIMYSKDPTRDVNDAITKDNQVNQNKITNYMTLEK